MDFKGSEAVMSDMATTLLEAVTSAAGDDAPVSDSKRINAQLYAVEVDHSRDALLTDFGKETLKDRYLLPGESYQDLFVRVASAYADDQPHAQRLYDYISRLWFMPSTPVLSNGGANRGRIGAAGHRQAAAGEVDLRALDAGDLGDLLGDRGDAVLAGHTVDDVGGGGHARRSSIRDRGI